MEVDALDYATGGILSIECKDGKWWLVAFLSKSLNETEENYEIHDKEMLAVIRGLENWRHLLEGAKYKFKVLLRLLTVDSILFPLFILFYFYFYFIFIFLFLEQLGLGFISHAVTSVTKVMA